MTVKIPKTFLLTLLSSAVVNSNARNVLIPKHVADARRCEDENGKLVRPDIQPIIRPVNELEMMHDSGEPVYLSQLQLRPQYTETKTKVELALEGQIDLAELQCEPNSCTSNADKCVRCSATYCMTNIDRISEHPEKYYDWMQVVDTEHCRVQPHAFGFNVLYDKVMEYDAEDGVSTFSLPMKKAIFDLGQTDSERITKAIAMEHTNRVLVNAQPLNEALTACVNKRKELLSKEPCDRDKVIDLVRKVAYLACRTTDTEYEQCIAKFPPEATPAIDIFEEAFPEADIFFVYDEPEIFMGGTFTNPGHPERAQCAKNKRQPSKAVKAEAAELGKDIKDLTIHEICSVEARVWMKKALNQKQKTNRVKFVHADDLMDNLHLFVGHGTDLDQGHEAAMRSISNTNAYGKVDDGAYGASKQKKHQRVNSEMQNAADKMMSELYVAITEHDAQDKKEKEKV